MADRAHTLIIGGQPDYHTGIVDSSGNVIPWTAHGRELVAGDAEDTLDGAPSIVYRLPSSASGELFFKRRYNTVLPIPYRGIAGIVHNITDVGANFRAIVATSDVVSQVLPTGTVGAGTVNTASTFEDVNQDPYGTITTRATPTTKTDAWSIEVNGFTNAATLASGSQLILVRLKWNGTYAAENTAGVAIELREGVDVWGSKQLRLRPTDGDTFVIAVLTAAVNFANPLMSGLSVYVSMEGTGNASKYWEVEAIAWLRIVSSGIVHDTGWVGTDVYTDAVPVLQVPEYYYISELTRTTTALPYVDGDGLVTQVQGEYSYILGYWDDAYSGSTYPRGRPRMFDTSAATAASGSLRTWRPEIGLIGEGPAYGTHLMDFDNSLSVNYQDIVRTSKGGNRWVTRRESPRVTSITLSQQPADGVVQRLLSVLRRTGMSRPMFVSVRRDSDVISPLLSLYGVVRFRANQKEKTTDGGGMKDRFSVTLDVEEVL